MTTTASIIVEFGGGDDELLTAELDSVLNGGRSSFQAGESVYFRVYHTVDYEVLVSSGTVSLESSDETEDIDSEILSFIGLSEPSISKRITAVRDYLWFDTDGGNNYGEIQVSGSSGVRALLATVDSVGVASLDYRTTYDVWKITPPSGMANVYHIAALVRAT